MMRARHFGVTRSGYREEEKWEDLLFMRFRLLVDLGQELVVAEESVLLVADLEGAAAVLRAC